MVGAAQGEGRRRPRVVRRVCRRWAGLRVIVVVVFIIFFGFGFGVLGDEIWMGGEDWLDAAW